MVPTLTGLTHLLLNIPQSPTPPVGSSPKRYIRGVHRDAVAPLLRF